MLNKFRNPEVKVHYKMYKKGKQWVFAAITTSSLALGLMAFTSVSSSAAEQSAQNSAVNVTGDDENFSNSFSTTSNALAPTQLNSDGLLGETILTSASVVAKPTVLALAAVEEGLLVQVNKDNFTEHFSLNGAMRGYTNSGYDVSTGTATLTQNRTSQSGNFTLNTKIDMTQNFTLVGEVYLGENLLNSQASNFANIGADGIGFAFHSGAVSATGTQGGALGIGGLNDAFGFKLDTFDNGDSSAFNDDPFGAKDAFGAFVYTENRLGKDRNFAVTEASTAQSITSIYTKYKKQPVTFEYKIENNRKIMKVYYAYEANADGTRNSGGLVWSKDVTNLVKDSVDGYAFNVSGSTGAARNLQQFTIKSFNYKLVSSFTGDFMLDGTTTKLADSLTIDGKYNESKNISPNINAVIKSLYNKGYDYKNTTNIKESNANEYRENKVSQIAGLAILNIDVNYDATASKAQYNFERKAGSVTVVHEYRDKDNNVVNTISDEPIRVNYDSDYEATKKTTADFDFVSGTTTANITRSNPTATLKLVYKAKETMGTVTVNHIDESGKILSPSLVKSDVKFGVPYTAQPVEIPDYELVGTKDNKGRTITLSSNKKTDSITFVYKLKKGTIKVNYVDEDNNPISTQLIENNIVFRTPYIATEKAIANYDYVGVKDNKNKVISLSSALPNDEITFVYATTQGKVTVEHIYKDVDGNVIPTATEINQFDSKYGEVFTPKTNVKTDYIVESTTPGTVTLSKENRNQKITIYYKIVAGAEVTVENVYLDDKGNKVNLKNPVKVNGTKGAIIDPEVKKYEETLVATDGTEYAYEKTEGTEVVKFTGEEQTITNIYKVVAGAEITVENVYLDDKGNKVNLKDPVKVSGNKGATIDSKVKEYATTLESSDGTEYAYEKTEGTEIVKFTGEKQTITNYYQVVTGAEVTVENVYLDDKGNKVNLKDPVTVKGNKGAAIDPKLKEHEETLESSDGTEYAYEKTTGGAVIKFTDQKQTITNYYQVVAGAEVTVENVYLDDKGNKVNLKDPVTVKGNKGAAIDSKIKEYASTLEATDGTEYAYEKTEGTEIVKFTGEKQTITNIYKVVVAGDVIVKNVYLNERNEEISLKDPVVVKGNKGATIDPEVKKHATTLAAVDGTEYAYESTTGKDIIKFTKETQTITNYYKAVEGGEVVIENVYLDDKGNKVNLKDPVKVDGKKGAAIDPAVKMITATLVAADGTEYAYEKTEGTKIVKFTGEKQVITNIYKAVVGGDVIVENVYLDDKGNKVNLKDPVTVKGNKGAAIDPKVKEVVPTLEASDGTEYTYKQTTGSGISTFTTETQTITNYYTVVAAGDVIVKNVYLDENNEEVSLKDPVVVKGNKGSTIDPEVKKYATTLVAADGTEYAYERTTGKDITKFTKETQTITNYYKAVEGGEVVVENLYLDDKGNKVNLKDPVTVKGNKGAAIDPEVKKYATTLAAADGTEYAYEKTEGAEVNKFTGEKQIITNIYKVVAGAEVTVENVYLDDKGNKVNLKDPVVVKGNKGAAIDPKEKEYAATLESSDGTEYAYEKTTGGAVIKFTGEKQTITNIYKVVAGGEIVVENMYLDAEGNKVNLKDSVSVKGNKGAAIDPKEKEYALTLAAADGTEYAYEKTEGTEITKFTGEKQTITNIYKAVAGGEVVVENVYLDAEGKKVNLKDPVSVKGNKGAVIDPEVKKYAATLESVDGIEYAYEKTDGEKIVKFTGEKQTITNIYKVVAGADIVIRNVYKDKDGKLVDLIVPVPHKGVKGALISNEVKVVTPSLKGKDGTEFVYESTNSKDIVKFTADSQTIINYYAATAAGDVIVKYVTKDSEGKEITLIPSVTASGNVGQTIDNKIKTYEEVLTGPDGIRYKFTKSTGTEITNFIKATQEIVYNYEAIGTITVNHVFKDEDGKVETERNATESELFWKFGDVYEAKVKTTAGYTMESITKESVTLTKDNPNQEITIVYKAEATKGAVTVNHIFKDTEGNEIKTATINESFTSNFGVVFDAKSKIKEVENYEVESISTNAVTLTKANPKAEINIYYKVVAGAAITVRNVYKDENGNLVDLVNPSKHEGLKGVLIDNKVKSPKASYKGKDGTEFVYDRTNSKDILKFTADPQTIINYYVATAAGDVIVKYVTKDSAGKEIALKASVIESGNVGEVINEKIKTYEDVLIGIDGIQYKFTKAKGIEITNFSKETQEIVYNYEAIQAGDVLVNHIYLDVEGNPVVLESSALKGKVGEAVDPLKIVNKGSITKAGIVYNYSKTNRNSILRFTAETQTITHIYVAKEEEKAIISKLTVIYKTTGGVILSESETTGEKGTKLPTVEQKKFEGYNFKGIEGNLGESYTDVDQTITYIYEPITVVIPPKEGENSNPDPELEPVNPKDPEKEPEDTKNPEKEPEDTKNPETEPKDPVEPKNPETEPKDPVEPKNPGTAPKDPVEPKNPGTEPKNPIVDEATTGGKNDNNEKEKEPEVIVESEVEESTEDEKVKVVAKKQDSKDSVVIVKDELEVKPLNSENTQAELPQTGSTTTETTLFGAMLLAIAAFFGIRKRKPATK